MTTTAIDSKIEVITRINKLLEDNTGKTLTSEKFDKLVDLTVPQLEAVEVEIKVQLRIG